ncbi:MAG: 4Fe-4S binding protein [Clostridia bacterium]|nr:4Fe-4S binding protein [Clostridia bacterium]
MARKYAAAERKVCAACGVCVKTCPREAIMIHKGCYAVIDGTKCIGCGKCAESCPAGCIFLKEREQV